MTVFVVALALHMAAILPAAGLGIAVDKRKGETAGALSALGSLIVLSALVSTFVAHAL